MLQKLDWIARRSRVLWLAVVVVIALAAFQLFHRSSLKLPESLGRARDALGQDNGHQDHADPAPESRSRPSEGTTSEATQSGLAAQMGVSPSDSPRALEAASAFTTAAVNFTRVLHDCAPKWTDLQSNGDAIAACHEAAMRILSAMSEAEQYELAEALSDGDLRLMAIVVVKVPWPQMGAFVPLDRTEKYPPGLARYMLEAAAGVHGQERAKCSLDFFQACCDCPRVAYEPARQILAMQEDEPKVMKRAIMQLMVSPTCVGEQEMWQLVHGRVLPELRGMCITALCRQKSQYAVTSVLHCLNSPTHDEVMAGVQGLRELARSEPELLAQGGKELEAQIVATLDSQFNTFAPRDRREIVYAMILLQDGAASLQNLATAEPVPANAEVIRAAAARLSDGATYRDLVGFISSRFALE